MGVLKSKESLYLVETRRCVFVKDDRPYLNFSYIHSMTQVTPQMLRNKSLTYDYVVLD